MLKFLSKVLRNFVGFLSDEVEYLSSFEKGTATSPDVERFVVFALFVETLAIKIG